MAYFETESYVNIVVLRHRFFFVLVLMSPVLTTDEYADFNQIQLLRDRTRDY